jgi:RNA polymerase sigma factor (sigma-70 family)
MPLDNALDAWFVREILACEEALARYLQHCWPHRDELHDLRQEIYVRVYEAASRARPAQPKSFLFTTARNLMTDRLRRGQVVSIESVGDIAAVDGLIDEVCPERRFSGRQALKRLSEAIDLLPDRMREVVWLRRVEEMPQKQVAQRLGISEKTVEKWLANGVRLLTDYFYGGKPGAGEASPTAAESDREVEHGRQQAD